MTVYYTKEKAKFGGITGSILPFTIKLPEANDPSEGDWKKYLPAGYLRCNGQILKADQFPALAIVLGTGADSKFAKDPESLADDEFQLPDLGAKYIRASLSSGEYLNTTLQQDDTISKVGTETEVTSLVGDSVDIGYSGTFTIQGVNGLNFTGVPFFTTTDINTFDDFLSDQSFQAHGHNANVGIFSYLGNWTDNSWSGVGRGGNVGQFEGNNALIPVEPPTDAGATVAHNHRINLPTTAELKTKNNFEYSYLDTTISADGLRSTVTITTENLKKLDDAISPYILVEYIIKI